jgi:hypothetical protein
MIKSLGQTYREVAAGAHARDAAAMARIRSLNEGGSTVSRNCAVVIHGPDNEHVGTSRDMGEQEAHNVASTHVDNFSDHAAHVFSADGRTHKHSTYGTDHPDAPDKNATSATYRESDHDHSNPTRMHWPTEAPTKPSGKNNSPRGFGHGSIPDATALHRDQHGGVINSRPGGAQHPQGAGYQGDVPSSFTATSFSSPKPIVSGPVRSGKNPQDRTQPDDIYKRDKTNADAEAWDLDPVDTHELEAEITRRRYAGWQGKQST